MCCQEAADGVAVYVAFRDAREGTNCKLRRDRLDSKGIRMTRHGQHVMTHESRFGILPKTQSVHSTTIRLHIVSTCFVMHAIGNFILCKEECAAFGFACIRPLSEARQPSAITGCRLPPNHDFHPSLPRKRATGRMPTVAIATVVDHRMWTHAAVLVQQSSWTLRLGCPSSSST